MKDEMICLPKSGLLDANKNLESINFYNFIYFLDLEWDKYHDKRLFKIENCSLISKKVIVIYKNFCKIASLILKKKISNY